MKPIINIEYTARAGEREFKEESIAFHSPADLFSFVSPGGGCERIADDIEIIQMVLLPHHRSVPDSPVDEVPATLELGMIFLNGPLADIVQISQQLLGKASRDELSPSFMKIIGVKG